MYGESESPRGIKRRPMSTFIALTQEEPSALWLSVCPESQSPRPPAQQLRTSRGSPEGPGVPSDSLKTENSHRRPVSSTAIRSLSPPLPFTCQIPINPPPIITDEAVDLTLDLHWPLQWYLQWCLQKVGPPPAGSEESS